MEKVEGHVRVRARSFSRLCFLGDKFTVVRSHKAGPAAHFASRKNKELGRNSKGCFLAQAAIRNQARDSRNTSAGHPSNYTVDAAALPAFSPTRHVNKRGQFCRGHKSARRHRRTEDGGSCTTMRVLRVSVRLFHRVCHLRNESEIDRQTSKPVLLLRACLMPMEGERERRDDAGIPKQQTYFVPYDFRIVYIL